MADASVRVEVEHFVVWVSPWLARIDIVASTVCMGETVSIPTTVFVSCSSSGNARQRRVARRALLRKVERTAAQLAGMRAVRLAYPRVPVLPTVPPPPSVFSVRVGG